MCLYVPNKELKIASKPIYGYKVAIKKDSSYLPYFQCLDKYDMKPGHVLTNDCKVEFRNTEDHWPHEFIAVAGLFHCFVDSRPFRKLLDEYSKDYLSEIYILKARIPKNTEYVRGFTHCFSTEVEETYGSTKIIYSDPCCILSFHF